MKSGYYIYNDEKYVFQLENNYMTVMPEKGVDIEKFLNVINNGYKRKESLQILRVKIFPNWNDAIIFHREDLDCIGGSHKFKIDALIEFINQEEKIEGINFFSKELDYMYDLSKAIERFTSDSTG